MESLTRSSATPWVDPPSRPRVSARPGRASELPVLHSLCRTSGGWEHRKKPVLDVITHGDIIIVDGRGITGRAVWREFMRAYNTRNGEGVIDGVITDSREHEEFRLPVFHCEVSSLSPHKADRGLVRGQIGCIGVSESLGDIVGGMDGVAFVPLSDAESVLDNARSQLRREDEWFELLEATERTTLKIVDFDQ